APRVAEDGQSGGSPGVWFVCTPDWAAAIMIRDLDATIQTLLETLAPPGSELADADISFDLPDAEWRGSLANLTVNCYLYDVRENLELRTNERLIQRSELGVPMALRRPPVRIDCTYCITAWSPATA